MMRARAAMNDKHLALTLQQILTSVYGAERQINEILEKLHNDIGLPFDVVTTTYVTHLDSEERCRVALQVRVQG